VDTVSGSKDRRPELDRLMADAHKRRFDAVAVWKFDRFVRSVSHLLRALETFNALGIAFASLTEQVDTTTPAGKMVFTVLGAVAELERSLIVERVRAGLRNAKAKGRKLGRPAHDCGCPQNSLPSSAGAHGTGDCRRVGIQSQPCPQNPCELRFGRHCKCRRLAAREFCPGNS
jgi:DNA invertase Pin-like site-specific DNA recombinase